MSFQLAPMTSKGGTAVALHRPVLLVGRHSECDLRLDAPKISRRHCCFALAYDRLIVRDLGSRNGVRVNGRKIDESRLFPGDEVAIGPLIFRVEPDPNAVAPPPAKKPETPDEPEIGLIPLDDD